MAVKKKTVKTDDDIRSKPRHIDFLIVGGGVASAIAAETLRVEGASGSVLLLSADELPPYHRPPLSKQLLPEHDDEARIFVHPLSFYSDHQIELRLNRAVVDVDAAHQIVRTADGERFAYGKLLIASGATPKALGIPGEALDGVHAMRTKADTDAIREAAATAKHAVVIGGSFLGMEIAMSLMERGLDVTVIERGSALLPHLEAPGLSGYFERHMRQRGATVVLNDVPVAFHGSKLVTEIQTAAGQRIACDLVVVSVGVIPATGFLEESGIKLEDGYVAVDSQLRASAPNVFAAGDVTSFYDPVFARQRHIEHWDNAIKQARLAARNMLGRRLRYDEVSYFFCEVGDIGFNVLGATEEADEWISRGSLDDHSFALFYLKGEVLRALFSTGRPADETRVSEGLIRYRVNLGSVKARLQQADFPLEQIPTQTALILQGGGALGAFECGVVKALEEQQLYPDIVAGVSIGAFNGAIIASNPRQATRALEAFWNELAVITPAPSPTIFRQAVAAAQILTCGVPSFFRARWLPPFTPWEWPATWTSFYDTTPMRQLIAKHVDFTTLKASPVRLLISAVNVATAELEVFDSYVDDLTPDHIVASGSLPPGFPWTVIDGKAYWDGGIISNSPLDLVVDRCGPDGKRVFIVDLYSGQRALPANMIEVLARRDEVVYSERVRSDLRYRETVDSYRRLIDHILGYVEPAELARVKHLPGFIQLMGDGAPTRITRFVRTGRSNEHSSADYDFSDVAIEASRSEGYAVAKTILGETHAPPNHPAGA
ncbi:FAD-dependent pyridine nucleotide-disulfide oxidoreductase [Sphingobium sp. TKS]|nr:FAD-dependent pyridine nucleotide-disulfide oxidoreductase [Sphingobium sp. TKS]